MNSLAIYALGWDTLVFLGWKKKEKGRGSEYFYPKNCGFVRDKSNGRGMRNLTEI